MKKEKVILLTAYIIMAVCTCGIAIWVISQYRYPSNLSAARERLLQIESGFTDAQGQEVDIQHLQKIDGVVPGEPFSIYYELPEKLGDESAFSFRTKNIHVQVYLEGECLYQSKNQDDRLNSRAAGTNWHYVELPVSAAGKKLEFLVTVTYKSASAKMDNIRLGSARESLLVTLYDKVFAIITCILFLFVGIVLILADIPLNAGVQKNHELLYLGLFSVNTAVWCLASTYVPQIFSGDGKAVHIISCCFLMLIPVAITFYLLEAYGRVLRIFGWVIIIPSFLNFILVTALQLFGKVDYQEALWHTHIFLGMSAVLLMGTMVYQFAKDRKKKSIFIFRVLRGIGIGAVGVSAVVDIIRFNSGAEDTGRYVRVGLLLFIICYGLSSLERSIETVRLGVKAEVISHLAYQDGLTELGNRTLFNERLAALEEQKQKGQLEIAITMFDVNDLKKVNDQMGHQYGDQLIIKSAELIRDSYGVFGECFRIGGDEFVVLMQGAQLAEKSEVCRQKFEENIMEYNANEEKKFAIRIASGCEFYLPSMGGKTLSEVYEIADGKMYECKRQMKMEQQEGVR